MKIINSQIKLAKKHNNITSNCVCVCIITAIIVYESLKRNILVFIKEKYIFDRCKILIKLVSQHTGTISIF